MGTWTNNDGLTLYYGTDKAAVEEIGEFRFNGPARCTEISFTHANLPTVAQNSVIISDKYSLPIGCKVERVEITSSEDLVGSGATLNIGYVDLDGTSNADVDAFVVEATIAEMIAGGTNVAGWVGTVVDGVPFATAKYITWEVNTAAITDGTAKIRIYWSV